MKTNQVVHPRETALWEFRPWREDFRKCRNFPERVCWKIVKILLALKRGKSLKRGEMIQPQEEYVESADPLSIYTQS